MIKTKKSKRSPDWNIWISNYVGRWYVNKNFPNVLLRYKRMAGLLYPYYFIVGYFDKDEFVGRPDGRYAGMDATWRTDECAAKLQKEYDGRN